MEAFLGNGVYLPSTDVGTGIDPLGAIFDGNIGSYIREQPHAVLRTSKDFQHSSEALFREFGVTFDMTAPIKVLQLNFGASFSKISGSLSNVTSAFARVESYSKRVFLATGADAQIPLSSAFLQDFRALPEPPQGALDSEWVSYRSFLFKWGTHYVSNIFFGSWLSQWSVASSTLGYSERQLEARACAKLKSTTVSSAVPSIDACLGFTNNELSSSLALTSRDTLEVKGGEEDTAAALHTHRNETLVQDFIRQGRTSNHTVRYGFTTVWRPLLARFSSATSSEFRRAMALEAYYNGFLAFGCTHRQISVSGSSTLLQEFRKKSNSASYQCVRGCVGCRHNDDCNYNAVPAGCWCYGRSCIAQDEDDRAQVQTRKDNLPKDEGPNRSCYYNAFPSECRCDINNKEDPHCDRTDNTIPIWDQDNQ